MSTPLFSRKAVFAAKIESTPGTAESITVSEGVFNAQDLSLNPTPTFTERPSQGGVGRRSSIVEGHVGQMTFRTELSYNGTTLPTWASVLLPACGVVNNAGVFSPVMEAPGTNVKTLTLARYLDGKRRLLRGASGTFTLVGETGKLGYIDWTFTGIWVGETDLTLIAPSYPTDKALRVASGTTSYDSVSMCCRNMTFNINNTVVGLECNDNTNNDSGYHYFLVTDRNPTIVVDPLSRLVSGQNRINQLFTSAEHAFAFSVGAGGGASVALAAPKAQILSMSDGDRDGMSIDQLTLQCNRNGNSVDQEFSLTFVEAA
jgi:hypothetical protein